MGSVLIAPPRSPGTNRDVARVWLCWVATVEVKNWLIFLTGADILPGEIATH